MSLKVAELDCRVLHGAGAESLSPACAALVAQQVLGAQVLSRDEPDATANFPVQVVRLPRLGDIRAAEHSGAAWSMEAWLSGSDCRQGRVGTLRFSCDGQLLYGTLQVPARDLPAGETDSPLQQAAAAAYTQIFAVLTAEGYPHLWRVWNYLADINNTTDGLERYRQFNVGRHQAFEAHGRLQVEAVPAACALGTQYDEVALSISFLAARDMPRVIENPRQVAAYEYPPTYGPRSPTFARAALAQLPGQALLFISGTASIVGHASVHPGDVRAQTRETLVNIQFLLDEATRVGRAAPTWQLRDLSYRAYLRHAADYAAVREVLAAALGADARVEFVQADICRAELLVEIEAIGILPVAAALVSGTSTTRARADV